MILVTGATGHLGNVLVRELLNDGEKVRALVLAGEDKKSLAGLDIEIVEGNILDFSSLKKAFTHVDVVFHLAALVAITHDQDELLRKINVDGTRNVVRASQMAQVRRFVYTSSIHALTRPPMGVVIDENVKFDVNNPASAYDRTKAEASLVVLQAVKEGLDAVIVCPTGVIGTYDYRRSEMGEMILSWMSPQAAVLVDGWFDFVDVRDVARGHILAAKSGRTGETYILSGEQIAIPKMKDLVAELCGLPSRIIKIPMDLAMLIARLSPIFYRLSHTRPRFTTYSLETITSNSKVSNHKAALELGYSPRPLRESITDTVTWWLQNRTHIKPTLRV